MVCCSQVVVGGGTGGGWWQTESVGAMVAMEESCSSIVDISILTDFLLATNCNLDNFLGGGVLSLCWDSSQGADELDASWTKHDANMHRSIGHTIWTNQCQSSFCWSLLYLFSFSMSMIDIASGLLQLDNQRTGHEHDIKAWGGFFPLNVSHWWASLLHVKKYQCAVVAAFYHNLLDGTEPLLDEPIHPSCCWDVSPSGIRFLESKWLFFKSKWLCIKKIVF